MTWQKSIILVYNVTERKGIALSKKLIIVESPSKSKTIEKYLGNDYKVVSSLGHIRDLSTSGKFGFGVDLTICEGVQIGIPVYWKYAF